MSFTFCPNNLLKWRFKMPKRLNNLKNFDLNEFETSPKRRKTFSFIYRLFHYTTYRSYRNHLRFLNSFMIFAVILMFADLFAINAEQMQIIGALFFAICGVYSIEYFNVIRKGSQLIQDSDHIMQRIAISGVVSASWHVYDGAYRENEKDSIEITFTRERAVLTNMMRIIRKKNITLPLTKEDIENLKTYVRVVNESGENLVVYGTITSQMADQLRKNGIMLTPISNRYRDKPLRWDWACANGRWNDALLKYPKFKTYLFR